MGIMNTPEHELFRQSLRKYLQKEIVPHFPQWYKERQVPDRKSVV